MRKEKKWIRNVAAVCCMCVILGGNVYAGENAGAVKGAKEEKQNVKCMQTSVFGLRFIDENKKGASFTISSGREQTRIGVFDVKGKLVSYADGQGLVHVGGLKKNKLYYYRACTVSDNGTQTADWSAEKAFTTVADKKFKVKVSTRRKTCTIKVPKVAGIKNYTVNMTSSFSSGYKKVKTIKPGKTAVIKKIKNKVFRSGKTYYISIQTNTKKNIPCSNFYYDEITF